MDKSACCLGIDPGLGAKGTTGWALVDMLAQPRWICGGAASPSAVCDLAREFATDGLEVVVIEKPKALHNPMANAQVIACAWAGGEIAGHLHHLGMEIITLGPEEWRQLIIGPPKRDQSKDRAIKIALMSMVAGIPRSTSVHARDALGVAICGWGRRTREGKRV